MCYILIRQPESGLSRKSTAECVESFGEPAGVRFLSLCQGFEPFGQFRQTLVPRSLGITGLRLGSVAKQAAHIGITFNVSDPCEIKVTSVRLRLAREGVFQILVTLRAR